MYDWIIEADIYRLKKAFNAAATSDDRRRLTVHINAKEAELGKLRPKYAVPFGLTEVEPVERISRSPNYQY